MGPHRVLAFAVPLMWMCAACGGKEPGTSVPPAIKDSLGIEIATSTHPLVQDTVGWSISSPPLLQVSTSDRLVVHWIRGAVRLDDGRIAVISESARQILFFSSTGKLLSTAGREGNGPGEFRAPFYLTRDVGDTLIVADRRSHRLSWFSPNGRFIRQEVIPLEQLQRAVPEDQFPATPQLVTFGHVVVPTPHRGLPRPGVRVRRSCGFVLMGPDRSTTYVGPFPGLEQFFESRQNGRFAFFANNTILARGGHVPRLYIGESESGEIRVFSLSGRLTGIIRDHVPPPAITDRDVKWERWELLDWGQRSGQTKRLTKLADAMPLPARKPAFQALIVDSRGYLWAKEYTSYKPEPAIYRIYDTHGLRVGAVRLPGRFQVFDIGDDYVLGVAWDLDYAETIQMYRLVRPRQDGSFGITRRPASGG